MHGWKKKVQCYIPIKSFKYYFCTN